MLNRYMNKALEVINNMPFEEKMLYMSLCFDGAIMDKDFLVGPEDEVPCVLRMNTTQRSKDFNPKHILRDKSKAGYHNGSAKQGFGSYDRFGKDAKLAKDSNKDLKAQMLELNEVPDTITITEAVDIMYNIYSNYFGGYAMDIVYYHNSLWYDNLQDNISMVKSIHQEYVDKLPGLQVDLFNSAESLFLERGMGFQNKVVEEFNNRILGQLDFMKNRMIHWLISRYKDNREMEMWEEEERHTVEKARLEALMEEADNLLKETRKLMGR